MFISKINFNQQQAKNLNSQQKGYVSFKGLNSNIIRNVINSGAVTEKGTNIVKTALMSLTAFAALQGFTYRNVKEAAENGELDMIGKKINPEGEKTKTYVQNVELKRQLYSQTHMSKEACRNHREKCRMAY